MRDGGRREDVRLNLNEILPRTGILIAVLDHNIDTAPSAVNQI